MFGCLYCVRVTFDFAAVVHPMSHAVGSQPQPLNTPSGGNSTQMLSPSQGQSSEAFYGTNTPPQDLNQPPSVDALTASLGISFDMSRKLSGIH